MKEETFDSLIRYKEYGLHPGNFLYQVLTNNLLYAMEAADNDNVAHLREIVRYIHDELPWNAWGSERKVKEWLKSGGLKKQEALFV